MESYKSSSRISSLIKRTHIGKIIDINDPKKEWRIKVDIKGLFSTPNADEEVDKTKLPWIYPENPGFDCGQTPKLGQKVLVWFDGDIRSGRYRSWEEFSDELKGLITDDYEGYKSIVHDAEEELQIAYRRGRGIFAILGNNFFEMLKEDGTFRMSHDGGKHIVEVTPDFVKISYNNGEREYLMNSSGVSTKSDHIFHGSIDDASQPCVLGDTNASQLNSLWEAINKINSNLKVFGDLQAGVSVGIFSPLKPGFKKISADSNSAIPPNNQKKAKVPDTLSEVNKLD